MSAWFFLGRRDQCAADFHDELIVNERNRYQATRNQSLKYRKRGWGAPRGKNLTANMSSETKYQIQIQNQ